MKAKGKPFSLLRKVGATHSKSVGPGGTVVLKAPGISGDTAVMRANKPGTTEFEQRKKQILSLIAKDRDRRTPLLGAKPQTTLPNSLINKLRLPFKKEAKPAGIIRKTIESVPVVKSIFKMTPEEELIHDVSLSFITGLKHGVFMSDGPLSDEKKDTLKGWLDLLSVGLPPEWGLHMLIDALSRQITFISASDINLNSVINKFPLSRGKWSKGCRKYDGSAGFSCGMWKLFHIVTVGVAEHRGGLNLVESGLMNPDTVIFSPLAAADAIREYMSSFFGCDECRNHFLSRYDDCAFRRCERLTSEESSATADDWKQLALWMWEVHNDVNVRVAGKKLDRIQKQLSANHLKGAQQLKINRREEDEIRVIWPSLENCLLCFQDDGRWNEDSVFEFLERTYWDAPDAKFDRLLTHRSLDGEDPSGGGFIWIMIIIACAIVLLVRQHVNNLSFQKQLRKFNVSSVIGVKNKLGDVVAGKHRTA
jgi:Erv1 / Alr family